MKLAALFLVILALPGSAALRAGAPASRSAEVHTRYTPSTKASRAVAENNFDLSAFGAVGDGVADDGPALQSALEAIANAGGGTLFVPAGRYAISTPVQKNFAGLASSVTILGVESSTPVAPPTSAGQELTRGLDLVSEFAPRTGQTQNAITISGLENFLIKDIVFIGTPGVNNDALVTLALHDISQATIRHCEFYGLSSLVAGAAIIQAVRCHLTFDQSVVLGSACSSGVYSSIIENIEWKGVTISEAIFADYGQRAELYGKMTIAPFSWISLGNAAAPENDSPRREAVVRSVFLDEGGYIGISSLTYRYSPPTAPIDLLYITDLFMNVSNMGTTGNYLYGLEGVLIEKSHYGWSHNTDSAINLLSVENAIIDEAECVASADRIRADAATGKLTVINSIYAHLDSQAQTTKVITTATPEEDPVQYVRQQFMATLGRAPDAAAHFYWSNQILACGDDTTCVAARKTALATYLGSAPSPKFAINGRITDENGASLPGVAVTLSGAQSVTTTTDSAGQYHFSNLPTSGVYTVTPTLKHHTLSPGSRTMVTPSGDQVFDSAATFNHHKINGLIKDAGGVAIAGVAVTLSGSQSATVNTGADGSYSFANLPAGGSYTVSPRKTSYTFSPANQTFPDLGSDQSLNFTGTFVTYTVSGIIVSVNNNPLAGVTVTLSGSQAGTATTNSGGTFSFTLPSEGNYTVTPTLVSYTFSPASRTFNNLAANQNHSTQAIYTTHSVSGRITDATTGAALSGASVTFSGFTSGATTTDVNGNYSYNLPHGGSYTLTAAKAHYTFAQPTRTFTNLTTNQTANFTATLNRYNISGRATGTNGSGLSGVSVTLSGSQTSTATTDSNGAYAFANLPGGGNYSVKTTKTSYSWAPQSLAFNNLSANQTANFTGTFVTYKVSGRVTENGTGLTGVAVLLSGSQTSAVTTDGTGSYSFTLPSELNYTITLSKEHYTFSPAGLTINNLAANQVGDFVATRNRHTLSGRVNNINNTGVPGITVALSGSQTATVTTNSSGDYSFASLPAGGNYTVAPSLQFHSFSPASQTYANLASNQHASFVGILNTHTISGRINTTTGSQLAGATVALSGAQGPIATLTTGSDGNYSFGALPAGADYVVSVSRLNYVISPASRSFSSLNSNQTADFSAAPKPLIEFSAASYNVSEGTGSITINVTRTGDTSGEVSVTYSATNGTGTQGKDVAPVFGQLVFASGETSRTFTIFITDDAFVETIEQLSVTLSNPEGGATLGARSSVTLNINDNDTAANPNPIDNAQFFVRQHYRDFLNREPDADGLAFWSNQIMACGTDSACVEDRRINVSAAFFLSIEFQETGFLVHRVYKASFAQPPQYLNQFLLDARMIAQGVGVGAPAWRELLEANKSAFLNDFVERPAFGIQYPLNLTPAEFVNLLNAKAGSPLSAAGVTEAVAEFNGAAASSETDARVRALRRIAESETFSQRELSPAFVLMQYFGYLQRNPSDPPNSNLDGYNFWLSKLNEFGGDFRRAEMVKAFLVSSEYRSRFGL